MENIVIKYSDDITIDFAALPAKSQRKFVVSGINHVFGNEVSSQTNGHFKKLAQTAAEATKGSPLTPDEKKAVKADVDTESDEYIKVYDGFLAAKWQAALAGTLGDSVTRGITRDPFAAKVQSIAKSEVLAMLRKGGYWTSKKDPTLEETWEMNGVSYSFEQLIERRKAKEKVRIEKEANAFVKAEAAKKKALAEQDVEF